jgi:hypothetical protein
MSGNFFIVREMSGIMTKVREMSGSVREFHSVWKMGTLILTFAHIVVAIPVFMLDYMTLTLIKYFVKSLKFASFKRLRY